LPDRAIPPGKAVETHSMIVDKPTWISHGGERCCDRSNRHLAWCSAHSSIGPEFASRVGMHASFKRLQSSIYIVNGNMLCIEVVCRHDCNVRMGTSQPLTKDFCSSNGDAWRLQVSNEALTTFSYHTQGPTHQSSRWTSIRMAPASPPPALTARLVLYLQIVVALRC
jgi:hypothetical protein